MTTLKALFAERRMSAAEAAALIASGSRLAMGLGISQPPALMTALADRAGAGQIEDVNLYYMLSLGAAGETVLRYELTDRIRPYSLFHGAIERRLDQRGREEGRQGVWFVPAALSI